MHPPNFDLQIQLGRVTVDSVARAGFMANVIEPNAFCSKPERAPRPARTDVLMATPSRHAEGPGFGRTWVQVSANVATRLNEKPDRLAYTRIVVRLAFCVAEPHQAAVISASRWQSRARALMCLSKGSVRRNLLLFLLAGLLLCLLRFLGHVVLCKKTGSVNMRTPCIDMRNIETISQMQN